jgi:hypothetical protein
VLSPATEQADYGRAARLAGGTVCGAGAPPISVGRSIFCNVATRGGPKRLALLLRRISFWLQLFAIRGGPLAALH